MPNVILVNDILRERVICYDTFSRQLGENIVFHRVTSVVGPATDQDVAIARANSHSASYRAWLATVSSYRGVGIQIISPTLRPEALADDGAGGGTAGPSQLPTQTSGLIRWLTSTERVGATGRRYSVRGRIYVPFPSLIWSGFEGEMLPAGATALDNIRLSFPASTTVVGTGISVGLQMIIRSGAPVTNVDVTNTLTIRGFATQRRRGDFGQTNPNPIG